MISFTACSHGIDLGFCLCFGLLRYKLGSTALIRVELQAQDIRSLELSVYLRDLA
jgi:hypothetical protein